MRFFNLYKENQPIFLFPFQLNKIFINYIIKAKRIYLLMRIKLRLDLTNCKSLPFNYNYYFSSLIYKLLGLSSKEFATQLHDEGYKLEGKTYKLFTFALRFESILPHYNYLELLSPRVDFFISSPIEDFINYLISAILKNRNLKVIIADSEVTAKIVKIEICKEVIFFNSSYFRLLSPLVLSTKRQINGNLCTYYLRYTDSIEEVNRILNINLKNKFAVVNNYLPRNTVSLIWDNDYINKRLSENKYLSSKVTIDIQSRAIDVVGMKIPFTLTGDVELIKTGYECGFGEKNSMGFGMAELYN